MSPDIASRSAMDRVRRHLVVRGRVQGVGFRASCARAAADAGVAGWVRNVRDGVEVVIEGDPESVAPVEEWCRRGPRTAVVFAVDATDETPRSETTFEIL